MADRTLALYVMTSRGFAVTRAILERFGGDAIERIVAANDPATSDTSGSRIEELGRRAGVGVLGRSHALGPPRGAVLFAGWRWFEPGCERAVVLHDSLLPRFRGHAPLVTALLCGEPEVGVSAFIADDRVDAGPIVGQRRLSVRYPIRIQALIEAVEPLYAELAVELAGKVVRGEALDGRPQVEAEASYSLWREDDDYWIPWTCDAAFVRRFVDAVGAPYRGARTHASGLGELIVHEVEELDDLRLELRDPGKVLRVDPEGPVVVCGKGLVRIRALVRRASGESVLPLPKMRIRFGRPGSAGSQ